jgi:CRISPR-associated protein Csb2
LAGVAFCHRHIRASADRSPLAQDARRSLKGDDRRSRKAYGLVLKALARAGYTTPVCQIDLQAEPVFPGAEMAPRYRVPAYLREFPRAHVLLTFDQPVPGPVAIGAGRHVGLGIFASLE